MKLFLKVPAALLALLPVLAQAQSTPIPNRVDGYGAPTSPATTTTPGAVGAHETEVDILGSYYVQDGDHSAVEGGRGTQHLTDFSPTILLNLPLDSVTRLSANIGTDFYASASTDRIDQVLSSPSSHDNRIHADFGLTRQLAGGRQVGVGVGVSKEYDYTSFNLTGSYAHTSLDGNRELSLAGQIFLDQVTVILPAELRPSGTRDHNYGSDNRQSFNLSGVFSQVLTQRLQVALSAEFVVQRGLLATPFQRVYFRERGGMLGQARPENLPRQRVKYPVGLRLTYYATDLAQLRAYYRFYNDDFGIRAHSLELEVPLKITPFLTFYPFYRYHIQTAANFFAPYLEHSVADEFYTSDYDLAAFSSHKSGLGLRYAPLYGLSRFKTPFDGRIAKFKSLDVRYGYYRQSTGLTANIVSVDLSFTMP